MRKISVASRTVLDTEDIMHTHLVKMGPIKRSGYPDEYWYHTTGSSDVSITNNRTGLSQVYTSQNTLSHIDAPRQSASVDREAFKIVYADPTFNLRAYFERGFSGVPVEIFIMLHNTTDQYIGVDPGMPLNRSDDLITVYSGTTDTASYNIDLEGGEATATIECTSPMGALGMVRTTNTNREVLRQSFPTDTSYDQLFLGSKGLTLLWGKVK